MDPNALPRAMPCPVQRFSRSPNGEGRVGMVLLLTHDGELNTILQPTLRFNGGLQSGDEDKASLCCHVSLEHVVSTTEPQR
jgi:hypothetical protein